VKGRALPMVFSPSTCPLPLGSAARPRTTVFVGDWLGTERLRPTTTKNRQTA
jgi:hypothetical protein